MSKKIVTISERQEGKKMVKLTGVSIVPAFKKKGDKWIPDKDASPVTIAEAGGHTVARLKIKATLTGAQKLNILDEKESPDGEVVISVTIWDKFQIEAAKKLTSSDFIDILLVDVKKNEAGYYVATGLYLQKATREVKKPWQVSYLKTIQKKDVGKTLVQGNIKFSKLYNSEEYIELKKSENGEYGKVSFRISLHKKTAIALFGEEDKRVKEAENSTISYFISSLVSGRIMNQIVGLTKGFMDKTFLADVILEKSDEGFYNGHILSLAFVPDKDEEENKPTTSESEAAATTETPVTNNSDVPEFPDLTEETEEEADDSCPFKEDEEIPEFPSELDM